VDDPLPVRGCEPLGDLDANVHGLADRQALALQPLSQRLALQKLGDQVVDDLAGTLCHCEAAERPWQSRRRGRDCFGASGSSQ